MGIRRAGARALSAATSVTQAIGPAPAIGAVLGPQVVADLQVAPLPPPALVLEVQLVLVPSAASVAPPRLCSGSGTANGHRRHRGEQHPSQAAARAARRRDRDEPPRGVQSERCPAPRPRSGVRGRQGSRSRSGHALWPGSPRRARPPARAWSGGLAARQRSNEGELSPLREALRPRAGEPGPQYAASDRAPSDPAGPTEDRPSPSAR